MGAVGGLTKISPLQGIYRMNTWFRMCGGVALLGFGVVNIAFAMATGAMPSATRFKVIFYLVLFVLPGTIELKAAFVSFLSMLKRPVCT
jgi:hypothetical protein